MCIFMAKIAHNMLRMRVDSGDADLQTLYDVLWQLGYEAKRDAGILTVIVTRVFDADDSINCDEQIEYLLAQLADLDMMTVRE